MQEKTADFYYNKATTYFEDKIYNLAVQNFQKALELQPDYPHAFYNLGMTLFERKEFDQAIECFKKSLEQTPDDASSYSNLALIYLKKKEHSQALDYYKKAVSLEPDNFGLYKDIGDVYLKNKDHDSAIEWYNKAIAANSCFIAAKQALKWAQDQKKNNLSQNVHLVTKEPITPIENDDKSAEEYFNLGLNCVKTQNLDEALINFRKCLKLDQKNLQARQFINKIIELKQKAV